MSEPTPEQRLEVVREVWGQMMGRLGRPDDGELIAVAVGDTNCLGERGWVPLDDAVRGINRLVAEWDSDQSKTEEKTAAARKNLEEVIVGFATSHDRMGRLVGRLSQDTLYALFCGSTGEEDLLSDKTKKRITGLITLDVLVVKKIIVANSTTPEDCVAFFSRLTEALAKDVYLPVLRQSAELRRKVLPALGI